MFPPVGLQGLNDLFLDCLLLLVLSGEGERQRNLNLVIVAQRQRRATRRIDPVERRGRVRTVLLAELRVPDAPSQLAALLEMGEGVACPVPAAAVSSAQCAATSREPRPWLKDTVTERPYHSYFWSGQNQSKFCQNSAKIARIFQKF